MDTNDRGEGKKSKSYKDFGLVGTIVTIMTFLWLNIHDTLHQLQLILTGLCITNVENQEPHLTSTWGGLEHLVITSIY